MVKLEDASGEVAFIAPEYVTCLTTVSDGATKVWDVSGRALDVGGTPDEVHANLFPAKPSVFGPSPLPLIEDVNTVLEWVSVQFPKGADMPAEIIALARKALGR